MDQSVWDLLIVGGGASGMAAAIEAKIQKPDLRVAVLEKKETPGKKLRATGNGRCNITNSALETASSTIAFFEGMGIPTREDDEGRVYPFSESAPGVTAAMVRTLEALGAVLICDASVTGISRRQSGFKIKSTQGNYRARAVLLATGGKASPAYGCSGDGYSLAEALGHHVTKTLPVLTGVCCDGDFVALKGIRAKGRLSLLREDQEIFSETGEVQFTDYGISGICAFNLSRHLKYCGAARLEPYTILLDLAPGRSFTDLFEGWQKNAGLAAHSLTEMLSGMVKGPLAALVLAASGIDGGRLWHTLDNAELAALEQGLHRIALKPVGTMGFKMAQCTAGGIADAEIDPETMMSTLVPGLYFAGEIMNYDGPCGGYNLDHAFTTGRQAGRAAACAL